MPRRIAIYVCVALLYPAIGWCQSGVSSASNETAKRSADSDNASEYPPQAADDTGKAPDESSNRLASAPIQLLRDQRGLWTSPGKIRLTDATWLVPLGGLAAAMIATDSDVSRSISNDATTLRRYRQVSNYGVAALGGLAGASYLFGLTTHDAHKRETGFLSGEAAINSLILVEAMKYATRRNRPEVAKGNGAFWQSGGTAFPSTHAAVAWSIAGVIAHEYPSPFVRFLSYGVATAVSASRVEARQHFPSDVLIGSAMGWLVGEYVYRQHHDPTLPGKDWSIPAIHADRPAHWQAKNMGSPYVPLDSWVYASLDRLIALGYVHTAFTDMRPWTRMECARLMVEAQDHLSEDDPHENEASSLYHALHKEFEREEILLGGGDNASVQLESVYSRSTETAGKVLTDGYHFGESVINDFGRPYEQGFDNVTGGSGWAEAGPFAGYVRVEYQHAPGAPALPEAAREAIARQDFGPDVVLGVNPALFVPPAVATASVDQAHLLDAYVAMNLSDWQLSYGKQSLWWGPARGGSMMMGDNADPINMFRINRVTPFRLPSLLGIFGPMRVEFFIGRLSGQEFVLNPSGVVGQWGISLHPQPIIHGERLTFKPTENLEVGFSRTTDYGGPGYPLTTHSFLRSLFSTSNSLAGSVNKPGDRRSGLDFSYRVPGMRNGLTFYADGYVEDEISPIVGPDVAAWTAGLYMPQVPKISKLDLRVEGVYTDLPSGGTKRPGFFYYDSTWISGYQNSGHLLGSWIGRGGQGAQVWSSYWFTPKNKIEFTYRHQKVSNQFVANGGTVADAGVSADFWLRSIFRVSASIQYEAWSFPVLASRQANITTMIELAIWPKAHLSRASATNN